VTDSTPLSDLRALRDSLIAERRNYARLSMENFEAGHEERAAVSWAAKIKITQEEIEAIDRAIADEKAAVPRPPIKPFDPGPTDFIVRGAEDR
jgi:hypothetical protein